MTATNAFSGATPVTTTSESSFVEARETIEATVSTIQQIAQKIAAMDGIASREGMPALASAIDAASSGKCHSGMPVTDAIRQLADRSQLIAQEIGTLAMFSAELAERAGELLDELVSNIGQASDLLQVAAATHKKPAQG